MNPLQYPTLTKRSVTAIRLCWAARHCTDPTNPQASELPFNPASVTARDRTPKKLVKTYAHKILPKFPATHTSGAALQLD